MSNKRIYDIHISFSFSGNGLIEFDGFCALMSGQIRGHRLSNLQPSTSDTDMRTMFSALDIDGSGFIDMVELQQGMKDLGLKLDKKDIGSMMKEAGVNHGRIYYEGAYTALQH